MKKRKPNTSATATENSIGPSHNMATAQYVRGIEGEIKPWGKRRGNSISSKGTHRYAGDGSEKGQDQLDVFAAHALTGLLAHYGTKKSPQDLIQHAYEIAELMLDYGDS
ncbi:MAG: hypothetical protein COX62_06415 [Deltaproteobacteria bacterium CG_4_10_14_0_2_um_filter_43_8]|nr:MAG: hypothetical protein COV43_03275 [Deltaproteobacteria bacterium CG11_big_fil_rev_8_21_14_0_20_42_23]PJA19589.1 MAG: hypothetical protein COX62_06415 [Deltaproteobacteria bacterium CG_4_10_14_0_2_um_filter_43_8]PJC63797.1 MAG: hypothetical protein CO021_07890 [Deltaproteobacteria bacterium CG_4_9_14_0_2_um_filter_42_21]